MSEITIKIDNEKHISNLETKGEISNFDVIKGILMLVDTLDENEKNMVFGLISDEIKNSLLKKGNISE